MLCTKVECFVRAAMATRPRATAADRTARVSHTLLSPSRAAAMQPVTSEAEVAALGDRVPLRGELTFRNPETGGTIRKVCDNAQWLWQPCTGAVRLGAQWAGSVSESLELTLHGSKGTMKLAPARALDGDDSMEPEPQQDQEGLRGRAFRELALAGDADAMQRMMDEFPDLDGSQSRSCAEDSRAVNVNDPFEWPAELPADPAAWHTRAHSSLGRHTALMYAAQRGRYRAVRLLCAVGAEREFKNDLGRLARAVNGEVFVFAGCERVHTYRYTYHS